MSSLPRFEDTAVCPKCGGQDISAAWIAEGGHESMSVCQWNYPGEHIHRRCCRCRFAWLEAPSDASAEMVQGPATDTLPSDASAEMVQGPATDKPLVARYSGLQSYAFWARVNRLPRPQRERVYAEACKLQDLELRVFEMLKAPS